MSTHISLFGGDTEVPMKCSRAGCQNPGEWAIQWRNPKIHSEDRKKVWLACEEHLEVLREFLAARDFPIAVVEVSKLES